MREYMQTLDTARVTNSRQRVSVGMDETSAPAFASWMFFLSDSYLLAVTKTGIPSCPPSLTL